MTNRAAIIRRQYRGRRNQLAAATGQHGTDPAEG